MPGAAFTFKNSHIAYSLGHTGRLGAQVENEFPNLESPRGVVQGPQVVHVCLVRSRSMHLMIMV